MDKGKFWAQIPVYILRDHRHKAAHLRVLGAILSCPQPYFPSLREIAERSGHAATTCSRVVSEMVKFGTLEREQRYRDTNVYRLVGYIPHPTTVVESEPTTVVALKESLKEKNNISQKGFEKFCQIYPRHRLGFRKELKELWDEGAFESVADEIIKCVKGHAETSDWTSESGKYVPGAKKFLAQERWIDYSGDSFTQYEED